MTGRTEQNRTVFSLEKVANRLKSANVCFFHGQFRIWDLPVAYPNVKKCNSVTLQHLCYFGLELVLSPSGRHVQYVHWRCHHSSVLSSTHGSRKKKSVISKRWGKLHCVVNYNLIFTTYC